ncbi:uncharacterized protein J3R85_008756 [Psidium guajava]|nr:uncharacterized protein J3R85_008756 [Psidium guajava]
MVSAILSFNPIITFSSCSSFLYNLTSFDSIPFAFSSDFLNASSATLFSFFELCSLDTTFAILASKFPIFPFNPLISVSFSSIFSLNSFWALNFTGLNPVSLVSNAPIFYSNSLTVTSLSAGKGMCHGRYLSTVLMADLQFDHSSSFPFIKSCPYQTLSSFVPIFCIAIT